MVLVASRIPVKRNVRMRKRIADLNRLGMHVTYELVTPAGNDCSLSNFVMLKGLGDYYNIEVEHGDRTTHKAMIDKLVSYLRAPRQSAARKQRSR